MASEGFDQAAGTIIDKKVSRSKRWQWSALTAVLVVLTVTVGISLWLQFWAPDVEPASVDKMALPLPDKPSIAVLPFDNLSGDPEQQYFSDGLTSDIITDLSRFANLFVIASTSSFAYQGQPVKVRSVSEELGVRYVLEGSVQRVGNGVGVNVQLTDALSGRHLWTKRYDQKASDFFAIQEDIVRTIVARLASQVHEAEIERALRKDTDNLKAYAHYQRGWQAYFLSAEEANDRAREQFEKAIELDPAYARAYGFLTRVHVLDSTGDYGWGEDPEHSLDLALAMARKAIALNPEDYFSHWSLGLAYWYHGVFDRALAEYERALALNPKDAELLAEMADLLVKIGRAEQAVAQVKTAMRINPHHADWYFRNLGWAQYCAGQYDDALSTLTRVSNPPNEVRRALAATLVRLEHLQQARTVMSELLESGLDTTLEEMKVETWKNQECLERWIDDLRTAGLPQKGPLPLPDKPSIVVLPFINISDDPRQEFFADGMTEELITDLSKLSGLFVIARNSSFAYKGQFPDVRQVARELGVRYLVEGSVRRAGDEMRINAQLIDAKSGGHIWAERFDGKLSDVFALQDEVTDNIVTTLAVKPETDEQSSSTQPATSNVAAYDAFFRGMEHYRRKTPEDLTNAISFFEKAAALDDDYSSAYAALATAYWEIIQRDWHTTLRLSADAAQSRAQASLDKALANPTPLAHRVAAQMRLSLELYDEAIAEAERAVALNSNDADSLAILAEILVWAGRPAESGDLAQRAMRLDPKTSVMHYRYLLGLAKFGTGQYEEARGLLEPVVDMNPKDGTAHTFLISAYGHLGRQQDAKAAITRYKKTSQELGFHGLFIYRTEHDFAFRSDADKLRLLEGLRRAGVPDTEPGQPPSQYSTRQG